MKLEDLLMQPREDKQTKLQLQQQVEGLEEVLEEELQVKRVLKCAMKGPIGCCGSCSSLTPLLPFKVQMLLGEVAVVEEEIDWLERKINELKLDIYQEKKHIKEWEILQFKGLLHLHHQQQQCDQQQCDQQQQFQKLPSRRPTQIERNNNTETSLLSTSHNNKQRRYRFSRQRRSSFISSMELEYVEETEEEIGKSRWSESKVVEPNKISVELIKCLIGIFVKLNQTTLVNTNETRISKATTFGCTTPVVLFPFNNHNSESSSHDIDPYEILPELPDAINNRDVGPYKNFIQITTSTLDPTRLSECLPAMRRLRVLMQKLSKININCFTHKQKLAFWINVYNASVMNAFLKQGLPSAPEKVQALVNKAAINVGGLIFKASTIENLILRHPTEVKQEMSREEKEMLIRRNACGLDYPEPNVAFALCRGTWSSPALRFYTADEVMNELERAKVEYLEASVGIITTRKKILVPKLMQLHMKDFADDMESLVEWIYSQLPYNTSLKRLMIQCLNGGDHNITNYESSSSSSLNRIEIQPYASDFRYLIPV
ncbi:hypothetical protein ACP275_06G146200 [Erythranthe tilingii]